MKTSPKNKSGVKKLFRLLVNFIVAFIVYRLIIELGAREIMVYYIGTTAYAVTIAILFCVFYAKNGFSFSSIPVEDIQFPDGIAEEEKSAYVERTLKNRAQAKSLLYIIFPMILTVLLDYASMLISGFFS